MSYPWSLLVVLLIHLLRDTLNSLQMADNVKSSTFLDYALEGLTTAFKILPRGVM